MNIIVFCSAFLQLSISNYSWISQNKTIKLAIDNYRSPSTRISKTKVHRRSHTWLQSKLNDPNYIVAGSVTMIVWNPRRRRDVGLRYAFLSPLIHRNNASVKANGGERRGWNRRGERGRNTKGGVVCKSREKRRPYARAERRESR